MSFQSWINQKSRIVDSGMIDTRNSKWHVEFMPGLCLHCRHLNKIHGNPQNKSLELKVEILILKFWNLTSPEGVPEGLVLWRYRILNFVYVTIVDAVYRVTGRRCPLSPLVGPHEPQRTSRRRLGRAYCGGKERVFFFLKKSCSGTGSR